MPLGQGSQSSVGFGTETTYGTAATTYNYLPIKSESIQANRASVVSGTLTNNAVVDNVALGIKEVSGGFDLEADAVGMGQVLLYFNGDAGYTPTAFSALNYLTTGLTTVTASAASGLAVGQFRYKVAPVLIRTVDSRKYILTATSESTVTTSSGNLNVTVSWTNPTAIPSGFTHYGTAIYRSQVGGASASEKYLYLVVGAGTSYSDTGSINNGSTAASTTSPVTVGIYKHEFLPVNAPVGEDRLPSFTVHLNKNNDYAERYVGCRMNEFNLSAGSGNDIITASCSLIGKDVALVSETTPTVANYMPILGWTGAAFIDGGTECLFIESFNLNCSNQAQAVPGSCATPYNRDVASGVRQVSGSFSRQFEDHDFFTKMINAQEFSIQYAIYGEPVVPTGAYIDLGSGDYAQPFHNFCQIDLFRCKASKAGGSIPGNERIVETVEFTAYKSSTYNAEVRFTLYNGVSAYA